MPYSARSFPPIRSMSIGDRVCARQRQYVCERNPKAPTLPLETTLSSLKNFIRAPGPLPFVGFLLFTCILEGVKGVEFTTSDNFLPPVANFVVIARKRYRNSLLILAKTDEAPLCNYLPERKTFCQVLFYF